MQARQLQPIFTGILSKTFKHWRSTPCSNVRSLASLANKTRNLNEAEILSINRPLDHNDNDLTKVYRISVRDMKTIFTHGFPTRLSNRVVDFKDFHMIIRKPSLQVINAIRTIKEDGDDGTGKSITLCHVIHYCSCAKWLIIHVPSISKITNSKEPVEPSSWKEGRFDQPQEAADWLKAFKTVNHSYLDTLKTTKDYEWGRQEVIPTGSSIGQVVDTGMSRGNFATDAIGIILKEITNTKGLKVLYAVDGFNKLFKTSSIVDKNREYLHSQDLSLARHFTRILEPGKSLLSGCYVMALSRTGSFGDYIESIEINDQIGEKGMRTVGEHTPLLVENFSKTELHNYLLLLQQTDMFHKEVNDKLEFEVSYLTDRNPTDVNRLIKGH
eukprot:gene9686-10674_t